MTPLRKACFALMLFALTVRPSSLLGQEIVGPQLPDNGTVARQSDPEVPSDRRRRDRGHDVVRVGGEYTLHAGETARDVTVIASDGTIDGRVTGDVVVVLGQAHISSTAIIDGSLVVVGGGTTIAPQAVVRQDLVVVGGAFDAPADFVVGGDHIVIGPRVLGARLDGLLVWLTHGLLLGRPIVPTLPWVWAVVGVFFFVYVLLNLIVDAPVRAVAETLTERPLTAFVVGVLVLLLVGPICVLLAVSVVGLAVVPLVCCTLLAAWIVGKIGAVRWLGMGIVRPSSSVSRSEALRSFVIGFVVIAIAYMIPVLGMLTWGMVSVFGLGGATLAFIAAYRKENPAPVRPVFAPSVPVGAPLVPGGPMSTDTDTFATPMESSSLPMQALTAADPALFPHALFRDRLAAGLLDLVLVLFAWQFLDPPVRGNGLFLLLLAYFIGFWTWKGTTVGGIICQLRVVRVDNTPLRFADALVRGLSSLFSMVVLGLGFLWILKDPERQAWHDKIAGTYVVKVPRNWPL
jgi:uncharacterized RDD family membrane protein YckC